MPITQHDQPVYKLVCSNTDCVSDNWTALDEDGYTRYFDSIQAARDWGSANGWDTSPSAVLCPADAADARERQEQAEEITAAINYALGEHL